MKDENGTLHCIYLDATVQRDKQPRWLQGNGYPAKTHPEISEKILCKNA